MDLMEMELTYSKWVTSHDPLYTHANKNRLTESLSPSFFLIFSVFTLMYDVYKIITHHSSSCYYQLTLLNVSIKQHRT